MLLLALAGWAQQRIALLQSLIGQKDIFLPPLYARWKREMSHGGKPIVPAR
jgi:hypothetical protein